MHKLKKIIKKKIIQIVSITPLTKDICVKIMKVKITEVKDEYVEGILV